MGPIKDKEQVMINRKSRAVVLGVAAVLALSFAQTHQALAENCESGDFHGNYGFSFSGTRIDGTNPGPRVGAGLLFFDGNGSFHGVVTKSKNGVIETDIPLTGTYTMNTAVSPINLTCTGSATFANENAEFRSFQFVLVNNHKGFVGVQTDAGRATSVHGTRE